MRRDFDDRNAGPLTEQLRVAGGHPPFGPEREPIATREQCLWRAAAIVDGEVERDRCCWAAADTEREAAHSGEPPVRRARLPVPPPADRGLGDVEYPSDV